MRNRRVLCRRFRLRNRYRLEIFKKQKVYWRFQDFFCTFAYVKRYFTILLCSLYALLGMAQNNMQVAHYSTKEGLPHEDRKTVSCGLEPGSAYLVSTAPALPIILMLTSPLPTSHPVR